MHHTFTQPLYESRNYAQEDLNASMRGSMEKEQEINAEPFPDSYDSEQYDTASKHKLLEGEQNQQVMNQQVMDQQVKVQQDQPEHSV